MQLFRVVRRLRPPPADRRRFSLAAKSATIEGMTAPTQSGMLGVPAVWDAIASGYAEDVTPFFARYAEEALRWLSPASTARVVDVASGPGTMTFLVAPRVEHVSAV